MNWNIIEWVTIKRQLQSFFSFFDWSRCLRFYFFLLFFFFFLCTNRNSIFFNSFRHFHLLPKTARISFLYFLHVIFSCFNHHSFYLFLFFTVQLFLFGFFHFCFFLLHFFFLAHDFGSFETYFKRLVSYNI